MTPSSRSGAHPGGRRAGLSEAFPPWGLSSRQLELGACAQRVPGASPTLNAVAPPAYKEQLWGCLSQSLPRCQTDSSPLACLLMEVVSHLPLDPDLCLPRKSSVSATASLSFKPVVSPAKCCHLQPAPASFSSASISYQPATRCAAQLFPQDYLFIYYLLSFI